MDAFCLQTAFKLLIAFATVRHPRRSDRRRRNGNCNSLINYMTYTFEQLKEDVRKEAEALRVHATSEERAKLDMELLDPEHVCKCVYGLMCGECDNKRAIELIDHCAPGYYALEDDEFVPSDKGVISNRWSPIEVYIKLPEARNANLIAYLRGETETLEL